MRKRGTESLHVCVSSPSLPVAERGTNLLRPGGQPRRRHAGCLGGPFSPFLVACLHFPHSAFCGDRQSNASSHTGTKGSCLVHAHRTGLRLRGSQKTSLEGPLWLMGTGRRRALDTEGGACLFARVGFHSFLQKGVERLLGPARWWGPGTRLCPRQCRYSPGIPVPGVGGAGCAFG